MFRVDEKKILEVPHNLGFRVRILGLGFRAIFRVQGLGCWENPYACLADVLR